MIFFYLVVSSFGFDLITYVDLGLTAFGFYLKFMGI